MYYLTLSNELALCRSCILRGTKVQETIPQIGILLR